MPTQDTSKIKENIISILNSNGPSLPVHIAKKTELSLLFASAFLSELSSEKKVKISNMKVGNSPVYFIEGQEIQLEKFSDYLKSKEKEAFILLKEKNFFKDKEQNPAIRVALRAIKDFAIPFKKNEEIYWRYFSFPENQCVEESKNSSNQITDIKEETTNKIKKEIPENINTKKEKKLDIFAEEKTKKKKVTKKRSNKPNEKLFSKVKDFLLKENIEIMDFQSLSKEELILKVKEENQEKILVAYNKKRITDLDLMKTYKKINEKKEPYIILSLGSPSKKLMNLIQIIKKLDKIKNIEEKNNN